MALINWEEVQVGDKLGEGGFSDVFKGVYHGETVAVKKWKPKGFGADQQLLFARELQVGSKVNHPNLVRSVGYCPNPLALLMEYAPGRELFDILHDRRVVYNWSILRHMAVGIARGLQHLHSIGAIHRDVKSPNVIIDAQWNPKVCDFGLARLKDATLQHTGGRGTVYWTAPEILTHKPYNESVDVFSYAVLVWEMVVRDLPYRHYNDNMMDIAQAVVFRDERPPIPTDTPPMVTALMRRCWSKNPSERLTFTQILQVWDDPGVIAPEKLQQPIVKR